MGYLLKIILTDLAHYPLHVYCKTDICKLLLVSKDVPNVMNNCLRYPNLEFCTFSSLH